MTRNRAIAAAFALLYTAFLLFSTLGPIRQRLLGSEAPGGVLSMDTWLAESTWSSGRLYEFVANVVVFVPWGVLVLLAVGARWWWVAASAGLILTLTIEIIQIPLPRISDPRDLVANVLGTLIGVGIGAAIGARARRMPADPSPRVAG
jgi:glycopeptide antibiotics resistance protein